MGAVDGTIVNVALPTMVHELNTSFATIQWVVLAFLLGLTILMLSMGRLGDMIGKKSLFTIGLVVFTVGSALCGLSPNVYWLIGFRFLQSVGAAMTLALGVAIVTETWPAYERGKAIGLAGGIISLGIAAGPALGGVILQAASWHWIFFVNLPIGLLALALVLVYIPPLQPGHRVGDFDFAGAVLIGIGLVAFSLAMTIGQTAGFTSWPVLALILSGLLTIAVFVFIERHAAHPMVDLSLFQNNAFTLNLFTGFLTFVAIAGVVLLLPFYLELVMGLGAQQVGLLMAVVPIVLGILGPLSGSLSDRIGTRPVSVAGLVMLLAGYAVLTQLATTSTPFQFILLLLPVGLGMGTFQSPNNTAIMNAAPRRRLGIASGMLSMTRTLGQTAGIALLGALFAARLQIYAGQGADVESAAPAAIVQAMHDQFYFVVALIGLGLLFALWRWWAERGVKEEPRPHERTPVWPE